MATRNVNMNTGGAQRQSMAASGSAVKARQLVSRSVSRLSLSLTSCFVPA